MKNEHPIKGVICICGAVFLFASSDALSKYLTQFYPVVFVLWVRYVVHVLIMLGVVGKSAPSIIRATHHPKLQLVRGACLACTNLMFISALRFVPLAEGTSIMYLSPLLITVFSGPMLGERATRIQWIAVLIGFLGVLLIVRPGGNLFHPVALLVLGASCSFSLYQLITRKLNRTDSSNTTNLITGLVTVLITSAVVPFFWVIPSLHFGLLMIGLGISGLVSHLLLTRAYQHAKPSTLAPFTYCQLLFAGLIGYAMFGQMPDMLGFTGMLIIATGGLLVIVGQQKSPAPAAD